MAIDEAEEQERCEKWQSYCRGQTVDEFRKKQLDLESNNRRDYYAHHSRCGWLAAKREADAQLAAERKKNAEAFARLYAKWEAETERREAAEAYIKSMRVTGWNALGRYAYEECREAYDAWQATLPKG